MQGQAGPCVWLQSGQSHAAIGVMRQLAQPQESSCASQFELLLVLAAKLDLEIAAGDTLAIGILS